MASQKLVIVLTGSNGEDVRFSYNYAKSNVSEQNVKALANALVANGSVFSNPPVKAKSAKLVVQTDTEYNVSE